jgi:hypothetical protein
MRYPIQDIDQDISRISTSALTRDDVHHRSRRLSGRHAHNNADRDIHRPINMQQNRCFRADLAAPSKARF